MSAEELFGGGVFTGATRLKILEGLIPQSTGAVACRLQEEETLVSGEKFDCVIVSREQDFRSSPCVYDVGIFFCSGLGPLGLKDFEIGYTLLADGSFDELDELQWERTAKGRVSSPQSYRKSEVEDWQLEPFERADSYLALACTAISFEALPKHHPLLRKMKIQTRASGDAGGGRGTP